MRRRNVIISTARRTLIVISSCSLRRSGWSRGCGSGEIGGRIEVVEVEKKRFVELSIAKCVDERINDGVAASDEH